MLSKNELIEKLDAFIANNKIEKEDLETLLKIRNKLVKAVRISEILKWTYELIRFFNHFKDFF